jgi:hypothetical protein
MQGPKFRTINALKHQIEKAQEAGDPRVRLVNIPSFFTLDSKQVFEFLTKHNPLFFDWWMTLRSIYESSPKEFLNNPRVLALIEIGQEAIKEAFSHGGYPWKTRFEAWVESLPPGSFVAIRSDSDGEDGVVANAGGNLTLSYVDPNHALPLFGDVIASYFDERSLSNQLQRDANPFTVCPLSVGVQHLIDESSSIPVSGVFFSNEPLYVDGQPFTVMQISSTYGHGEAVVGSAGIHTDTYYVLRSRADPTKIYIVDDLQQKMERLAPKEGKLTEVVNPIELRNGSSLTPNMIQRLYDFAQFLNEHYEKPSDVEFVFKGEILHIVQRRDINRKTSKAPSYLDPMTYSEKAHEMKIIVSGHLQAQTVERFSNILIRETLDEAQFVKGDSSLVIVKQDEPKLSHPTINFKERETPVFFAPEGLEPPSPDEITVFSPQQGLVVQAPPSSIQLTPGYIENPAPIGFGRPDGAPARPAPLHVRKKIQNLMMELTAEHTTVSSSSFFQPSPSLKPIKEAAEWPKFKAQTEQAKEFSGHAKELSERVRTTAKELKRSIIQGPRLENLFFAKAFRILLIDGVLSLSRVLEQTLAFEEKSSPRLSSLSVIETLTPEMHAKWIAFLHALDKEGSTEEIDTFKRLLHALGDLQSLWITFYFTPHSHLPPRELLVQLMQGIDATSLEFVERLHNQDISFLEDFALFKTLYFNAPALIQLIALSSLARFVDTYDRRLKQIQTSPLKFPKKFAAFKHKLNAFHSLLYSVVTELVGPDGFTHPRQTQADYLAVLTEHCELLLNQEPNTSLLDPSENFNVAASRLGAGTVLGARIPVRTRTGTRAFRMVNGREVRRYVPQSFADWHTLDHQCLVAALSLLYKRILFAEGQENPLPFEIKEAMSILSSVFETRINLTGIEQTGDELKIKYNIPLRNHSGTCELCYREGNLLFSAEMLGEARERWKRSAAYLHLLEAINVLPFERISLRGNVLRFSCPIRNQADMEKACAILEVIHTYSLARARTNPEERLVQKLIETSFSTFDISRLAHVSNPDISTGIHFFLTELSNNSHALENHGGQLLSLTLSLAKRMEPHISDPLLSVLTKLYVVLLRSNPDRGIQQYQIPYFEVARLGTVILQNSPLFYGWMSLDTEIRPSEGIDLLKIALTNHESEREAVSGLEKVLEIDSGALIGKSPYSFIKLLNHIIEQKVTFPTAPVFLAKITDALLLEKNNGSWPQAASPLQTLSLLRKFAEAGTSSKETFEILEKLAPLFLQGITIYELGGIHYTELRAICIAHLNNQPHDVQSVVRCTLALATNASLGSPMEHILSEIMNACLTQADNPNRILYLHEIARHINQLNYPKQHGIIECFFKNLNDLHTQGAVTEVISIIQQLNLSPHTPFILHDDYGRIIPILISLMEALYRNQESQRETMSLILSLIRTLDENPNGKDNSFETRFIIELIAKTKEPENK